MGYFEGMADAWFKKKEDGKTIFYPNGIFSSGYIISTEDRSKIKKFLKKYYFLSAVIIPVFLWLTTFISYYALIGLILYIIFYHLRIRELLINAKKTREKMNYFEVWKSMAIAMGIPISVFIFIACLFMIILFGFKLIYSGLDLSGIFLTLFLGFGLIVSIFLVYYSIRYRKKGK